MNKEVLENSVSILDLEEEIFEVEGIRVVIRAPTSQRVPCGYKKLFNRCLGDQRPLKLLLIRIERIIGEGVHLCVVDGTGHYVVNKKTLLGEIRESYVVV